MSSLSRKVNRNKKKKAYKSFSKLFREERAYQRECANELSDDTPILGKRPPFAGWCRWLEDCKKKMENMTEQEKDVADVVKAEDLEWSDE